MINKILNDIDNEECYYVGINGCLYQDLDKEELLAIKQEIERLNNKEEQLIRRLEDLIIIGEQVENEWAVDICKMIIKELKGSE